jgi:tetratricopeptide (TPR) repeat protein
LGSISAAFLKAATASSGLNTLISQAQTAMQTQNWAGAEAALKQLNAAAPDTNRWEFYKALGDAQKNSSEFQDAVKTYAKGIEVGQALVSGSVPPDPKNPNSTPAAAKSGVGRMLTSQGNAYLSLEKPDEAVAAFKKAAEIDPTPAIAYYNLCAVEFNAGKYADAAAACDKSIAADATKADAWFFKGAALYKTGKIENGKQTVPPGTAEALNKYLQVDPTGTHVGEVKVMFVAMGQK